MQRLLADDFTEFGASGRVWTKQETIAHLVASTETSQATRTVSNFETNELADGLILVTYRCRHSSPDFDTDSYTVRSSIWRSKGETWQMVFHQGTPIPQ
ncbi:MAG: DUF4440 domain-containing protein [Acidobacteria bacterium]|nr:DUF4440 domain-containing protein [Acidobacteriota bacterium]